MSPRKWEPVKTWGVVPAQAGMSLMSARTVLSSGGSPRAGGDEPPFSTPNYLEM